MKQQRFTWDEKKRLLNLKKHGYDFAQAEAVFLRENYVREDKRHFYSERRFITLGFLGSTAVAITHTETDYEIRIISFRRADRRETEILYSQVIR
ncbi:BrnT family toxin [Rugamonas sp.]|uniref:BrnT family toxin n=1 Tax=Rugamonas sp. TaxID=1926287 RepID=UPI0025E9BCD2|nr:BrnT family toxin [Rugamonas sp.]